MIWAVPIYDYRCDHCGHAFSAVQSFTDETIDKCPNCGKRPRKLLVVPAVVFKGSGWYKTDSRSQPKDSDSPKSDAKDTSASSKDAKSETKSEAKPPADAKPAKGEGKS